MSFSSTLSFSAHAAQVGSHSHSSQHFVISHGTGTGLQTFWGGGRSPSPPPSPCCGMENCLHPCCHPYASIPVRRGWTHFAASVPRARHPPTIPKRMDRDGCFRPFRLGWQRESIPFGMEVGLHPRLHPLVLGWWIVSIPAAIPTHSIPLDGDGDRAPQPRSLFGYGEGWNEPMPRWAMCHRRPTSRQSEHFRIFCTLLVVMRDVTISRCKD